jgi:hypothetical protein
MREIHLDLEEFLLFNDDDQFGFFFDDDGYPVADAFKYFASNVADLYKKYEYISVDAQDNIYGIVGDKKELLMKNVTEAYSIAHEVKTR